MASVNRVSGKPLAFAVKENVSSGGSNVIFI